MPAFWPTFANVVGKPLAFGSMVNRVGLLSLNRREAFGKVGFPTLIQARGECLTGF